MLSKWILKNKVGMRVATSAGAITAMALVVAAPSKWH